MPHTHCMHAQALALALPLAMADAYICSATALACTFKCFKCIFYQLYFRFCCMEMEIVGYTGQCAAAFTSKTKLNAQSNISNNNNNNNANTQNSGQKAE